MNKASKKSRFRIIFRLFLPVVITVWVCPGGTAFAISPEAIIAESSEAAIAESSEAANAESSEAANAVSSETANAVSSETVFDVPMENVSVTFRVDMAYQVEKGRFDPERGFVDIAGTFNGWGANPVRLEQADTNHVYSVTLGGFTPFTDIAFKFRIDGAWDGREEFPGGGPNRTYVILEDFNLVWEWYNDEIPETGPPMARFSATGTAVPGSGTVMFQNKTGGAVSQWQWIFEGGSPSSSDVKEPEVSYNQPGSWDVTLIASHEDQSDTLTLENFIRVQDTGETDPHPWAYNLGMYEVNIRQYTSEGTFSAFQEHLDRLEQMGVGILWLMPIHPIGEKNRLGTLGSYYSVKDYRDVNPEFGTLDDFRALVEEIHDRGMYVLLDWVPNHTAWDHPLTESHPEWYVTDDDGNFTMPPGTNWSDVIQLDHSRQGLRQYMLEAMKYWVEEFDVDGFRVDAAGFVPDDFHREMNEGLRAIRPDIFLLAEDHGPKWYYLGYDMSFGWELYGFGHGVLKRISDGVNDADDLHQYVVSRYDRYPGDAYRMYFTSNHDENSWHGTTTELFGNASELFTVLTATIPGMPLIYSGQEAGLDKRLAFFYKDQIPWRDHRKKDIYTNLLQLKRNNPALWNGAAGGRLHRVTTSHNSNVYAFVRSQGDDSVFILMNLTDQEVPFTLDPSSYTFDYTGIYRCVFSEDIRSVPEKASLTLPPWGYRVLEKTGEITGSETQEQPFSFALHANYPNPFNSFTNIIYEITEPAYVELTVYDVIGRQLATLVNSNREKGIHRIVFDGSDLGSGIYILRLQAGNSAITSSMMLLK